MSNNRENILKFSLGKDKEINTTCKVEWQDIN